MSKREGSWVFSFVLDDDGRVSVSLTGGCSTGMTDYDLDTLLIEGAYEIIRQSETFASMLSKAS